MPPRPYRRGPQARAQLEDLDIPLFGGEISRLEAFEAAADEGTLVRDLSDRRARRGWEDYERVDQALADPVVVGEGKTNYSLLVESLLVRWLGEVGYPLEER